MISIHYGHRPGVRTIEKGDFICPLCHRKRKYERLKVVRERFFGFITYAAKDLFEFVECQSCLRGFPVDTLNARNQLTIELKEGDLPPANIMEIWQKVYTDLHCEDLLSKKAGIVEGTTPILITIVQGMQNVGVELRMKNYENARRLLVGIIKLTLELYEENIRQKGNLKKQYPKHYQLVNDFEVRSHILLSHLP
jgi:hypothetical protein